MAHSVKLNVTLSDIGCLFNSMWFSGQFDCQFDLISVKNSYKNIVRNYG